MKALSLTQPWATLIDARNSQELGFGNYDAGRFAYRTEQPHKLRSPYPARGSLGFWTVPNEIITDFCGEMLTW